MGQSDEIRISLTVDREAEPIGGRLSDGFATLPFAGWVELAALIERARKRELAAGASGRGSDRAGSQGR